ncbi:hypothetical protein [Alkaliphilus metalliredigens]|nr:hypothetical protein [Alkaliphilus metalliredigens]
MRKSLHKINSFTLGGDSCGGDWIQPLIGLLVLITFIWADVIY